ncbi:MAG: anaerobic ribonucleoside-triphosphate reductase [Actinomycetota bacterium]|nr:anaerobic ribonucleoside-triphosphate reductase [Actinomycetota bacterium]
MSTEIVILRCRDCGDVFVAYEGEHAACPSCGCEVVEIAREPLL